MKLRIKDVNDALRAAAINGRLRRGRGYFYFTGDAFDRCYGTSVYVNHLDASTVEQWVKEAKRMIGDVV
jgi:hypothetical protein